MNEKKVTIEPNCTKQCVLKVDERYFGYDDHSLYPETTYKEKKKAYVFETVSSALYVAGWHLGTKFKVLPAD